ncbi:MAG: hypothetical protein HY985_18370 [Magnetospirillum sp.]|nr:hypothetical protein [Magnetospirillum sp.]
MARELERKDMKTWMVRAGRGGIQIGAFKEKGRVAIGWAEMRSLAE